MPRGRGATRESGRLDGVTPEGVFFIQRLRLNRSQLIAYRLRQRSQTMLGAEVAALRQRVAELQQRIVDRDSALELVESQINHESA